MKKIIFMALVLGCFVFVACNGTPPAVNPEKDPELVIVVPEDWSPGPESDEAVMMTITHPVAIAEWKIEIQPLRQGGGRGGEGGGARGEGRGGEGRGGEGRGERAENQEGQEGQTPRAPRGAFFEESGKGPLPALWKWNGNSSRASRGGRPVQTVQSAADYTIKVTATDAFGNTVEKEEEFSTGIIVRRDGDLLKMAVASIVFPGGSADIYGVSEGDLRTNRRVLRLVGRALNRYPDYKVTIEGHSNPENAPGTPAREREETTELLPISEARARAVLEYLSNAENFQDGEPVDRARLSSVGMGGRAVVVDFDEDPEEKMANRRVEFILEK